MVVYKFIKNQKEYFIDDFEKKYPSIRRIFSDINGASIKIMVEENTCDNHTSFLIENHDNNTFTIAWCCEKHQ